MKDKSALDMIYDAAFDADRYVEGEEFQLIEKAVTQIKLIEIKNKVGEIEFFKGIQALERIGFIKKCLSIDSNGSYHFTDKVRITSFGKFKYNN
ncbi:hypothetical protein DKL61_09190 [Gammaproteobacteria bacterium ESL0073]|nr:hypothetical protein DKL61_09190 [Gammaproteobacteria bacterium ESL0073]